MSADTVRPLEKFSPLLYTIAEFMPTSKRGIFSFASSLRGGRKAEGEALSAGGLNAKAAGYFAAGDYAKALASCDAAIAADPEYYAAWICRGNALSALGRHEEAVAAYDEAITHKPAHLKAQGGGFEPYHLEKLEALNRDAKKYGAALYDFGAAWIGKAEALTALGRRAEAAGAYAEAARLSPESPDAWARRGDALYDVGDDEGAVGAYDKAIAADARAENA